jgi:hypothetical protein
MSQQDTCMAVQVCPIYSNSEPNSVNLKMTLKDPHAPAQDGCNVVTVCDLWYANRYASMLSNNNQNNNQTVADNQVFTSVPQGQNVSMTSSTFRPPSMTPSSYRPPSMTPSTYRPPSSTTFMTPSTYRPPSMTPSTYRPPSMTPSSYRPPSMSPSSSH